MSFLSTRLLVYVLLQALAACVGAWLGGAWGALIACFVAGLVTFAVDTARGTLLVRWLKAGEYRVPPVRTGLWGEAAERVRRLARDLNQQHQLSEDRLQGFLEAIQSSPVGVVMLDDAGQIAWANQTAGGHLGLEMPRDLGQWIGNLVRQPEFTAYYAGQHYSREVSFDSRHRTTGQVVKVSVQVHPYGDGRKLLLSRDVTALEQAEAMRRDFVANVSHEIRTPLTVLSGFVETLQNLPVTEAERDRYLGLMSAQAARMQSLVSDLLVLSKLEGSPVPSSSDWHSIPDLMRTCHAEARALSDNLASAAGVGEKPHQIQFGEPPNAEVAGNLSELQSAIGNLIANAVRYTPLGRRVGVEWVVVPAGSVMPTDLGPVGPTTVRIAPAQSASPMGARWALLVRDEGAGIESEHLPRLTERFYRVDRSRSRESGGTGLGLAIVKHVLHRHGAELVIHSVVGQGSCFAIVFPSARIRVLS